MDKNKTQIHWLKHALLALDAKAAEKIILQAETPISPSSIAGNLISDALSQIGDLWDEGNISLSQVYMSGIICEKIIDKILPPQDTNRKSQPKTAIAVVEDFHLLGKRIIYSTLRASGIELIDLGGGLSIEKIASIVKTEKIKILLLSVLMLPSALRIKQLKQLLAGVDVKIIVGGAPFRFDEDLWKEVGADYYGNDSAAALKIMNELIEENR